MLLLCCGPDTFSARKKARELVAAFRAKHDPQGYSTETIDADRFDTLLLQLGSPSLFAPKRLLRCDGLMSSLKIADVRKLAARLQADADQTIVLSVEDEKPTEKVLSEFDGVKVVTYPFPTLTGAAFIEAVAALARERGVDVSAAKLLAARLDGDLWHADQELQKMSANPHFASSAGSVRFDEASLFDLADDYLAQLPVWRSRLREADAFDGAVTVFGSQVRSFLRARDRATVGMHPFVVKKMTSHRHVHHPEQLFLSTLCALIASRTGLCLAEESETIL